MTCSNEERLMGAEDKIEMLIKGQHRLENEIAEMRRAVVALARMEERMANHMDGMHRLGNRIDGFERELKQIDQRLDDVNKDRWKLAGAVGVVTGLAGMLIPLFATSFFGAHP